MRLTFPFEYFKKEDRYSLNLAAMTVEAPPSIIASSVNWACIAALVPLAIFRHFIFPFLVNIEASCSMTQQLQKEEGG